MPEEDEIEEEIPGEVGDIEETGSAMTSEDFARFLQSEQSESSSPVLERIENLPPQEPINIEEGVKDFLAPEREPWQEEAPNVVNEPTYLASTENPYTQNQTGADPAVLRPLMNPETSALPSTFRHDIIPSTLSSLPEGVRRAALLDPGMAASGISAPAGEPNVVGEDLGDLDERKYMGMLR